MFDYRNGEEMIRSFKVHADTADIVAGDCLKLTAGFVLKVTGNGDAVFGIAVDSCDSPATSGAKSVRVAIGREATYEVPPSTGSFVQGDIGKKCDVAASAQAVLRTASTKGDIEILDVDLVKNTARVRLNQGFTGAS